MNRAVEYYMNLPYKVELKCCGQKFRGSIAELPAVIAEVDASDSIEKLWGLLQKNQREWIEFQLELGEEVPEPPSATEDPFWEEFEEACPHYEREEVRSLLHEYGVTRFPVRILQDLWLEELKESGLSEVDPSSGAPRKTVSDHGDQRIPWPKGDARLVRLGESDDKEGDKWAWIELKGPRTKRGYKDIVVLDKTLPTEAATVAALTVLEASRIENFDFERLSRALQKHVADHPELRGKCLEEVVNELPLAWFSARKAEIDQELNPLTERLNELERKERVQKRKQPVSKTAEPVEKLLRALS